MKPVLIYSRAVCPYCDMAKSLFKARNVKYTEKSTDEFPEEFYTLADKHDHRTVPMIFIGDEFIGGFDDVRALLEKGELEKKLA